MSYLVLARKYRPQAFADMTGQEHVVRTLANAIAQDRVAHAYLFCGPRGVGKTTAARLLAKALNCEKGPTATPCGVCKQCTEITAGSSVDVQEIDGASNNGVENVREIREAAKYMPQSARYKIYIIDEVHMLTGAAFNALLKTLEEPPPHVKFIFATTEPHKLPDTILSRCQRHNFRRIPTAMMIARLREILGKENAKLSDRALAMVARQSEGGMRDSLSLLDGILSAAGNEPTDEQVAEALGAVDRTQVHRLAKALLERNAKEALAAVEEVFIRGTDLKRLAEELSVYLRHVMVAKATNAGPDELADSEKKAVLELAAPAEPTQIARLFDLAHQSVWEVGRAAQPRLALEVALLKGIHLAPGAAVETLVERLESLTSKLGNGGTSASAGASAPARPGPTFQVAAGPAANTPPARPTPVVAPTPAGPVASAAPAMRAESAPPARALAAVPDPEPHWGASQPEPMRPLEVDTSPGGCATGECLTEPEPDEPPAAPPPQQPGKALIQRWKEALEAVKRVNPRLADSLSHARPVAMRPGEVVVAFAGAQAGFHRMQSERPASKPDLDKGLASYFGQPTKLVVEDKLPPELEQEAPASPAEEAASRRRSREDRLKKAAQEHPAVKAALGLFGGTLQEVRVRDEIPRPTETSDDEAPSADEP